MAKKKKITVIGLAKLMHAAYLKTVINPKDRIAFAALSSNRRNKYRAVARRVIEVLGNRRIDR